MTSRKEIYENTFSAKALFVAGILMMPALLFNPSTELRVLQFLFFLFLVFISGKKTRLPSVIIIIAGITAFNLVIPYGRILFSVGSFNITEGALRAGIHRAVTFQALVMLSKASIKQDLKMPGAFGELLGESLRIFSGMMDRKISVTGKNLIAEIDNLLLELSDEESPVSTGKEQKTKPVGFVFLVFAVILSWLPFILAQGETYYP